MFIIQNDYVVATFLHPNYRQLRGATPTQITDCYYTCCSSLLPTDMSEDTEVNDDTMETEITNESTPKPPKL